MRSGPNQPALADALDAAATAADQLASEAPPASSTLSRRLPERTKSAAARFADAKPRALISPAMRHFAFNEEWRASLSDAQREQLARMEQLMLCDGPRDPLEALTARMLITLGNHVRELQELERAARQAEPQDTKQVEKLQQSIAALRATAKYLTGLCAR